MGAIRLICSTKPPAYEFLNVPPDRPHVQTIAVRRDFVRDFCTVNGLAILGVRAV